MHAPVIHYAGFWRRLAATLIDTLLFMVLIGLLLGPEYLFAETLSVEALITWGISLCITVVLWVKYLGTPGKLLLDCQVVDADSHRPLTVRRAVLRNLAYIVSVLPLGLGLLWVAWDPRKQGFHDKIAHSVVLHGYHFDADDESRKPLDQLMGELR